MKAAWYEANGAAGDVLVVGSMDVVPPGPGDVRVRVMASGVNPSDVKGRAGTTRKIAWPRVIPQSDGAGIIEAVGTGVPESRIGERVWIFNAQWNRPFGTAAEFCTLPGWMAPPLPPPLDFAAGACLGIPVMTAHRCLFAEGPLNGLNVLVTGGAGVVGHYAIQLARWGGAARVIATVSGPEKAAHAMSAGADDTIDYRREDVAARLQALTGGAGIHRVVDVDLGTNLPQYMSALATGASIAAYASMGEPEPKLPFYALFRLNVAIRPVLIYTVPRPGLDAAIADIARWAGSGKARFAIARRHPLEQIIAAHEEVEAGQKLGHVILENR